jgi:hypothetical protein
MQSLPKWFDPSEVRITGWMARHGIPYAPTLEGQYIIKNVVQIGAGIVIGATVRGGAVVADPRRVGISLPLPGILPSPSRGIPH